MHHTALTLQTPSLTKVHPEAPPFLLFRSPFPALRQQTSPPLLLSNAPASGIRGPQVTPPPSPGPPLAGSSLFYNLCSLLLHRHAPSHSYTGVVISLELLLTVKTTAAAHQNIFNKSKDWTRSSWDLHCYFKPTWCLGAIRSTEFHTHLVASVLVYPAIVVQYCVIVQSFWPVIVFLPDKVSVVVVLKDKFTPKKNDVNSVVICSRLLVRVESQMSVWWSASRFCSCRTKQSRSVLLNSWSRCGLITASSPIST